MTTIGQALDGWTRPTTDGWFAASCRRCDIVVMHRWDESSLEVVGRAIFIELACHIAVEHQIMEPAITREDLTPWPLPWMVDA